MSYFDDNPDEGYPYRVRYIPDDGIGHLQQYSPENKSSPRTYDRFSGNLNFRIKNLIFKYDLVSNSNNHFKEDVKPSINVEESCDGEVDFGLIMMFGKKPTLSYFGTDKKIESIAIRINESGNDRVGFNSHAGVESTGGFFHIHLNITKSFFQNMKELVLAEKLQDIILEVNASEYPGLYEFFQNDIKILTSEDMVDNKDELHKYTDSHNSVSYAKRWSKDFTLHLIHPNKKIFVPDESNE